MGTAPRIESAINGLDIGGSTASAAMVLLTVLPVGLRCRYWPPKLHRIGLLLRERERKRLRRAA